MNVFQPLVPDSSTCYESFNNTGQPSFEFVVTEQLTFEKLSNIKSSKVSGPKTIPDWVLKENGDILALPECKIVNSSYQENRLPSSWKLVEVTTLPKQKPVRISNKVLRPTSLTPIISKLAEEVVVIQFIKPAILKVVDTKQFGTSCAQVINHTCPLV